MGIVGSLLTLLLIWKINLKCYASTQAPQKYVIRIAVCHKVLSSDPFFVYVNNISDN